ncbi:hypothetical protein M8J76_003948 [Diaphorina citri]|nr:hypothetical protein M8J75_009251 [Diaphorina citri]KAI5729566.1 hypothetical protein M8J76_003948 [Diaphorina citri]
MHQKTKVTTTTTTTKKQTSSQKGAPPQQQAQKELKTIPEDKTTGVIRAALKAHNEKRGLHGCPPLGFNEDLAKLAKDWAEKLIQRNAFEHRPDNAYGENIYMRGGTSPITDEQAVQNAVDSWYNEIKDYKLFGREPTMQELMSGSPTGHFTQLIWKGTKAVGIGIAKGDQNRVVVVANYSPAGNVVRYFNENVPNVVKK